jgi:hypothetical protein
MKLYLGLAGPLLLYVYLPLALIGLAVLFAKAKIWKTRVWAIPLYLVLAYAIPLGDVTWHSWNISKVCPKAGLHVYRTVVVDGFLGEFVGEDTLKRYPYVFVERRAASVDLAFGHFEHREDQIVDFVVPRAQAEWEYIRDSSDYSDKTHGVTVDRDVIRNRQTGEVIAENFVYGAWRGWIDAWIASVIDNSAGNCYKRPKMSEKFQEILIPSGAKK